MRQYVKNYELIEKIPLGDYKFDGGSVAQKGMIFHCVDNAMNNQVLDIGFGLGHLGTIIKSNSSTAHWEVDGIDGYQIACYNEKLFEKNFTETFGMGWHKILMLIQLKSMTLFACLMLLNI
jgi:hypothetical protein